MVRRRGFALLDVLVAGVLLGAALVTILSLGAQAMSAAVRGEELRRAAMLADEKLTEVLAVGPERYLDGFTMEGLGDGPFEGLEYRIEIDDQGTGLPFEVSVTVTWESSGRMRSETVETLMSPRQDQEDPIERQPEEPIERQ